MIEYLFVAVIDTAACTPPGMTVPCPPDWIGSQATGSVTFDPDLGLNFPVELTLQYTPFGLNLDQMTFNGDDGVRLGGTLFLVGDYLADGNWSLNANTHAFSIHDGSNYVAGEGTAWRVPEPGSLALVGVGLFAVWRKRDD